MGGGVSNLLILFGEITRLKNLPEDASDITDIDTARQELARVRNILIGGNLDDLLCGIQGCDRATFLALVNHDAVEDLDNARGVISSVRTACRRVEFTDDQLNAVNASNEQNSKQREPDSRNSVSQSVKEKLSGSDAKQMFKAYDKDKSGLLDRSELRRFLRMQGIKYGEEEFSELFNRYDVNNDGKFSFGEFIAAFTNESDDVNKAADKIVSSLRIKFGQLQSKDSFNQIDKDGSGLVDKGEMRRLLRMKGITYQEEEFEALFVRYDINGDGKLAYDEFECALQDSDP